MTSETKTCQSCKAQFIIASEDFEFYEKIKVPAPTWCPECRMKRRLIFWNQHNMYSRKCDATGKTIFSIYRQDSPFKKVFDNEYWFSDKWDAKDYSRDYDFSQPFFEQFRELLYAVPRFRASVVNMENSDFCANAGSLKNCYLTFNASIGENCYYCVDITSCKDCLDSSNLSFCELCYGCVNCTKCYQALFCLDCEDSSEIYFSRNLRGCHNCFGCVNLNKKEYHIFNKPYSEEAYHAKLKELWQGSYTSVATFQKQLNDFYLKHPVRFAHGRNNQQISGEHIYQSKNVQESYYAAQAEGLKYCQMIFVPPSAKDCYDYSVWGEGATLVYETYEAGLGVYGLKFCWDIFPSCTNLEYCVSCHSSSDLFGCVGMRKAQYCIFNKQYTKDEYERMVARIKEHMRTMPYTDRLGRVYKYGEYFPPEFSPFGYNESWLQDYYPLTDKEAQAAGYNWHERTAKEFAIDAKADELSDSIADAQDNITKKVIGCAHEGKCKENCLMVFKILPQELAFYHRMNLPLPRHCFNCRHARRVQFKNKPGLFDRVCQCTGVQSEGGVYKNVANHVHDSRHCPNTFRTPYGPERKEIVYCEPCYQIETT